VAERTRLRPAGPGDGEFLLAVYASTRLDELAAVPWSDEQREAFLRAQFAAQDAYWRQQRPNATWDVIEVDGRPAGRLYVERLAGEIRIVDIALLAEFRGCGIGTELLNDVLAEGDAGDLPVTIHVEQSNRARGLYERLGFTRIGGTGVYDLYERRPAGGGKPDGERR
jgi:ribosomal protein S18 acetylase RimI-like enzyme